MCNPSLYDPTLAKRMLEELERKKKDPKPPTTAISGATDGIEDPKIHNSGQAQRLKESLWDSRKKVISCPTDIFKAYSNPNTKITD